MGGSRQLLAPLGLLLTAGGAGAADVRTDGSAGPVVELSGPEIAIGADLGTRAGDNLFHSFRRFSIDQGERATFSGPAAIDNVIARVTGGLPSDIDGTLRSTIAGADLYFINPAGVVFGPNATLDVPGSVHVSTADVLRFDNGDVLDARVADVSSFSVAAPEAFGFLDSAPAPLEVDRGTLAVPPGETISLSGGTLTISGEASLVTPGPIFQRFVFASDGQVVLAALGENGMLVPATGATSGATGAVAIQEAALVGTSGPGGGGRIVIAGGDITIDDSLVIARNDGATDATGGVTLDAVETVNLTDAVVITATTSTGRAGDIELDARRLVLDGAQIDASSLGAGPAGNVTIDTRGRIDLSGDLDTMLFPGGFRTAMFAFGQGTGSGGAITIDASTLESTDGALVNAGTFGSDPAGTIELNLERLVLSDGAQVLVATEGSGDAGRLTVEATRGIEISGPNLTNPRGNVPQRDRSGLLAGSGFFFGGGGVFGDAGTIEINTSTLALDDLALIGAGTWTFGSGSSGEIDIAADAVSIAGGSQIGNSARSGIAGPGGDLRIEADEGIRITGSGTTFAGDFLRSGIFSDAVGGAPVGDIVLVTPELIIDSGRITSDTMSDASAGVIQIRPPDGAKVDLRIRNAGQIFAGTDAGGDGADIVIANGGTIEITGTSDAARASPDVNPQPTGIFSNVKDDGSGEGGDIVIGAQRLVMRQGAAISSQTLGEGAAGAIDVVLGRASIEDSVIETSVAETSTATTSGGQIAIRGGRLVDLYRARITTNGVVPAPGSSILTLAAPVVAINDSTVTSLTAAGEPRPDARSGVVEIGGDPLLISSDSLVAATSSVVLSGIDEELGSRLVVLPVGFLDANALLRERCAARRDVGASSFTAAGRGGLPPSPDQPLGSVYRPPVEDPVARPAALTLVIPCAG